MKCSNFLCIKHIIFLNNIRLSKININIVYKKLILTIKIDSFNFFDIRFFNFLNYARHILKKYYSLYNKSLLYIKFLYKKNSRLNNTNAINIHIKI